MKINSITLIFLIVWSIAISQPKQQVNSISWDIIGYIQYERSEILDTVDVTSQFLNLNFAPLLINEQRNRLGYIGANYQRFYINFSSVIKDHKDPALYHVKGKTQVKDNICDFSGKLEIIGIRRWLKTDRCENPVQPLVEAVTFFIYTFQENPKQKFAGIFNGYAMAQWYLDSLKGVRYDDLWNCSDGFSNNQFVGNWKNLASGQYKHCNWGDYRIPYSDDLDNGVGEFYPNEKYLKYGWSTYDTEDTTTWWK